jgi:hypothetical protein
MHILHCALCHCYHHYTVLTLSSARVGGAKARGLIAKYANRAAWPEGSERKRLDSKQRVELSEKLVERLRSEREPSISFY